MSVSTIRPRRKHLVRLSLPAGRWVWWDPWATPLHSDGSTAFAIQLPAGYHLLVHDSGAARAAQVGEDGTLLTTPVADPFMSGSTAAPAPRTTPAVQAGGTRTSWPREAIATSTAPPEPAGS